MIKLLELRTEQNLSQRSIAKEMHVSQGTYNNWENARTQPSIEQLIALADFFDVSVDYLIGRSDEYNALASPARNRLSLDEQKLITSIRALSPEAKKLRQLEIDTETLLLEHNVTPAPLYITRRRLAKADVQRWRNGGGRSFSVTYLPPKEAKIGKPFEPWVENMVMNNLDKTIPALAADGLMDGAYCYGFDEIKNDKFFAAMQLMKKVKAKYPNLKIITTTEDREFGKKNGLDKVVDAWCPQAERFIEQIDLVRQVQKEGKEVWYYVCCWDPGMDMLIEKSLTAPRLLCGFAQKKFGADGFLYYGVISGNKYQDAITSGPLTSHTGNNRSKYNGCGLLIYPTAKGPASCLRLKAMRDGFEDIEYYHLLKAIDPAPLSPADREERERLLNIPDDVVTGLENYDLSGRTTAAYRAKVGKFLDQVLKGRKIRIGKAPTQNQCR